MTEKNFRRHVIRYMKQKGAFVVPAEGLEAGTPDLLMCYNGRFVGLELKGSTLSSGKSSYYDVTAQQLVKIRRIKDAGGLGIVLRHTADWKIELEDYLEERKIYDCGEIFVWD